MIEFLLKLFLGVNAFFGLLVIINEDDAGFWLASAIGALTAVCILGLIWVFSMVG